MACFEACSSCTELTNDIRARKHHTIGRTSI